MERGKIYLKTKGKLVTPFINKKFFDINNFEVAGDLLCYKDQHLDIIVSVKDTNKGFKKYAIDGEYYLFSNNKPIKEQLTDCMYVHNLDLDGIYYIENHGHKKKRFQYEILDQNFKHVGYWNNYYDVITHPEEDDNYVYHSSHVGVEVVPKSKGLPLLIPFVHREDYEDSLITLDGSTLTYKDRYHDITAKVLLDTSGVTQSNSGHPAYFITNTGFLKWYHPDVLGDIDDIHDIVKRYHDLYGNASQTTVGKWTYRYCPSDDRVQCRFTEFVQLHDSRLRGEYYMYYPNDPEHPTLYHVVDKNHNLIAYWDDDDGNERLIDL